jgi:superfamily II DNA or RNA helicase
MTLASETKKRETASGSPVADSPKARELFIVDNSVSGWTGLRYLEEWTKIAKRFDIATGYFDIGALLALDGKWQSLEKIRILMGAEMTQRTRNALAEIVRQRALKTLDDSIEASKELNPFLRGVDAILDAMKKRKIECRIYDREKFHAKAYITQSKLEVIGSQALVGSSNFTYPGLTTNIELNVQIQSAREVVQLQEWFEKHWNEATEDVTDAVVSTITRHTRLYTPFDVYAKALHEFFRGHELTATEWDETRSKMYPKLDRYQKEAYWALMKIAHQYGGAFLCDGVGLGKTFVGLMLIERFVLHEGKRVVLFAPKATKEAVWEPHLREWLSHIGGGIVDFSNVAVFSHTDLGRKGDFPERFRRIAELADVVIIDEAHHFRNPGQRGDPTTNRLPSRHYQLFDLLDSKIRSKTVFMITATPVNNRLSDFRHMAELFTRKNEMYFARTLGINSLTAHFNNMERDLRQKVGHDVPDVEEVMVDVQKILSRDQIFRHLVVQRSRAYARESQIRETGVATAFPQRDPPQVASYSIEKTYGKLLNMFEKAFTRKNPLFTLAMYYPLAWYRGEDKNIDPLEEGRQKQVVGLIRTNFLKRFESSVVAFELSCARLLQKLLAFIEAHSETPSEIKRLDRWKAQNADILTYETQRHRDFWEEDEEETEEDIVPQEMLEAVEKLNRDEYNVPEMIQETFLDLDQIVNFLEELEKFEPKYDDKLQKLIQLLQTKDLSSQKVLIFTEFADTARYLNRQLQKEKIRGVAEVDSSAKGNRADIIKRFSPYYNGTDSTALRAKGLDEVRILISTDVLSEGLNLQDSSRVINYDIHWNPVRLMQRIGRVDRRMNLEIEKQLISDHPEVAVFRGKIRFWNFLPPEELNAILSLYTRVTQKTLLISRTFGIEGKKLLTPQDDYDALKEFNSYYEGTRSVIENMHLEYQSMIKSDPNLSNYLSRLPGGIYSGRQRPVKGLRGLFFCYALPALNMKTGEFDEAAGTTRWYFYDLERDTIIEEPADIIESIRSDTSTPRNCVMEEKSILDIRKKVELHIKNTYLKRVDAPIGVRPVLKCWMETNE